MIAGDKMTLKSQVRGLQDELDKSQSKITELRNEVNCLPLMLIDFISILLYSAVVNSQVIGRDKSLTEKSKEILALRVELKRRDDQSATTPLDQEIVHSGRAEVSVPANKIISEERFLFCD